jgi:hypothetical protein
MRKDMKKKLLLLNAILFATFLILPQATQASPVGTFTYLEGKVDITSPGKMAIPAGLETEVNIGDIIRAKSRSKAEITFTDGNILRIAQNTRVEITEYMMGEEESSEILNLYRGKIQSIVQEKLVRKIAAFAGAHRFEVHTSDIQISHD